MNQSKLMLAPCWLYFLFFNMFNNLLKCERGQKRDLLISLPIVCWKWLVVLSFLNGLFVVFYNFHDEITIHFVLSAELATQNFPILPLKPLRLLQQNIEVSLEWGTTTFTLHNTVLLIAERLQKWKLMDKLGLNFFNWRFRNDVAMLAYE